MVGVSVLESDKVDLCWATGVTLVSRMDLGCAVVTLRPGRMGIAGAG